MVCFGQANRSDGNQDIGRRTLIFLAKLLQIFNFLIRKGKGHLACPVVVDIQFHRMVAAGFPFQPDLAVVSAYGRKGRFFSRF
ncbi:hypothetical protein SDC9_209447 [bioreactor metagenome]|uniref:Uncharacterized protein n=1 Tax=bioreactor metagenome TaxID=1076179 RepID=A0A645JDB9_9ZZZZ